MSAIFHAFRNSPLVRRLWGEPKTAASPTPLTVGTADQSHDGKNTSAHSVVTGRKRRLSPVARTRQQTSEHTVSPASGDIEHPLAQFVSPPVSGAPIRDLSTDDSRLHDTRMMRKARNRRDALLHEEQNETEPVKQHPGITERPLPKSPPRVDDYSAPNLRIVVSPEVPLNAGTEAVEPVPSAARTSKRKLESAPVEEAPRKKRKRMQWADDRGFSLTDTRPIENCLDGQQEPVSCSEMIEEGKATLRERREQEEADQRREHEERASEFETVRSEFERIRSEIANATQCLLQKKAKYDLNVCDKPPVSVSEVSDKLTVCATISDKLIRWSDGQPSVT